MITVAFLHHVQVVVLTYSLTYQFTLRIDSFLWYLDNSKSAKKIVMDSEL